MTNKRLLEKMQEERFIYDVVLDYPINKRQIPLYRGKRRLPKILREKELNVFFMHTKQMQAVVIIYRFKSK